MESAQEFMKRVTRMDVSVCPVCKVGRLQVTALRTVLERPRCAGAIRSHNAIVQGTMPVRHDVDWLQLPQARS